MEGFTYTVSHDLRAPLRAIAATSMILLEEASEKLAAEERALLERQAHNAKHLGVLIDELLKLSRITRQDMAKTSFSLSDLAREVADDLGEAGAGNALIEIQPGLTAWGDPKLIRFVLLNLLENACKFSPEGGTVRLGAKDGTFFVSDEGIGFDPRYSDKLFRPFERLVTQDEFPGTGVGLANVKRIVERHGGQVWAESELGKGATFWFTLGRREAP
jgi:signal transduction histidine kinase